MAIDSGMKGRTIKVHIIKYAYTATGTGQVIEYDHELSQEETNNLRQEHLILGYIVRSPQFDTTREEVLDE